MGDSHQPWWATDPELEAIRRCVREWLESAQDKPPVDDGPDLVAEDFFSGASLRELANARDDFARAQARYEDAVRKARAVGPSWGEIARMLGLPRQSLHRRFRNRVG